MSVFTSPTGLIIDAFGDLRDQLEQVREDLESKCFICGIGKEYFDATPHGFDRHVEREHNFANYMWVACPTYRNMYIYIPILICATLTSPFRYFLMHIINKPDTEFTGQVRTIKHCYWNYYSRQGFIVICLLFSGDLRLGTLPTAMPWFLPHWQLFPKAVWGRIAIKVERTPSPATMVPETSDSFDTL